MEVEYGDKQTTQKQKTDVIQNTNNYSDESMVSFQIKKPHYFQLY